MSIWWTTWCSGIRRWASAPSGPTCSAYSPRSPFRVRVRNLLHGVAGPWAITAFAADVDHNIDILRR